MHNGNVDEDEYKPHSNSNSGAKKPPGASLSTAEEVDDIMDQSIEIESNKRMRNANVNPWTLRFKDKDTELEVGYNIFYFAGCKYLRFYYKCQQFNCTP